MGGGGGGGGGGAKNKVQDTIPQLIESITYFLPGVCGGNSYEVSKFGGGGGDIISEGTTVLLT